VVSGSEQANPYAIPLEDLERGIHVPYDDQTTESAAGASPELSSEWDEARRQARLAGGA
jgi:hypothetical protein